MSDSSDLWSVRDQAVTKSRGMMAKKTREIKQNLQEVKEAAGDVAAADSTSDKFRRCCRLLHVLLTGEPARIAARLMIIIYYVNLVYAQVEIWRVMNSSTGMAAGQRHTPTPSAAAAAAAAAAPSTPQFPFPYLHVCVLLPVSLMAGIGVLTPWLFSGVLLIFTCCKDAWITWVHLRAMLFHTGVPSELLMMQFAIIGAAAVLLAHSVRDSPPPGVRAVTAGLLRVDDDHGDQNNTARPGLKRSGMLLLGRLLLAALLLYAGYTQILRMRSKAITARIAAASKQPYTATHHYGRPDPHDNIWLLLQCLLAIPLALGFRTTAVMRMLFFVLLTEAVTAWNWWGGGQWPSWHYRQNVRDHFFLNVCVAGGLLLMQSSRMAGGAFAVDALLTKHD